MATIFPDWENFDVLDRGSLMGGGRTWMVVCISITNHFTKRFFTYRAVQYFAAQNEEKYQGNVVPVALATLLTRYNITN